MSESPADSHPQARLRAAVLYDDEAALPSDTACHVGRYPQYTRQRIAQLTNRLERLIYPQRQPVVSLALAGPVDRIPYGDATQLIYRPANLGDKLGPAWATYWVRIAAVVPVQWSGQRVDLHWDSHSEAMLWVDGRSIQGLNAAGPNAPFSRDHAMLTDCCRGGEKVECLVEVACNALLGQDMLPGVTEQTGKPAPPPYVINACELRLFDPRAWAIFHDYRVLADLLADDEPPQEDIFGRKPLLRPTLERAWAGKLMWELNRFCNTFDAGDESTWDAAQRILHKLLEAGNGGVVHEASAIGHGHLDIGWLWPIEETDRKCQRTFSSAIACMERYPRYLFAASQAYQYARIETLNPDLFGRIRAKIDAGQWRPVGGTWVEPDCNLPSGESLCRQFLYGQRYFESKLGGRSTIFWNPDVFGYNGQLPQIMREAGITRFLTQKLAWNRFTTPPHHTFHWRGIDGSAVLTHFPPADTYNGQATPNELRYHAANYKDADRSNEAYYVFGQGDGGGGPTERMLESLERMRDLQGVPRCTIRSPEDFFDRLEADLKDPPVITGELYFELHRGTFTSQAEVKRLNRRAEVLLHQVEFVDVLAATGGVTPLPRRSIDELWQAVLLHQFHDILPGTSIAEVYDRALRDLRHVCETAEALLERSCAGWLGSEGEPLPINTVGVDRDEVAALPNGETCWVHAPAYAVGRISRTDESVSAVFVDGCYVLENRHLRAVLSVHGELLSLREKQADREALIGPGNRLVLYRDEPVLWEAWDIDPQALERCVPVAPAQSHRVLSDGPLRGEVEFVRRVGAHSSLRQVVRLDAGARWVDFVTEVDWAERGRLLKVLFDVDVLADHATYQAQFGAVTRPTHTNSAADVARFECPGQRWVDLSEPGFGVSLLTDCKYGYSVRDRRMAVSLLRGAGYPDTRADAGTHRFAYAVHPHAGDWRAAHVQATAERYAQPLVWSSGRHAPSRESLFRVDDPNVIIDTVKFAEDNGDIIVRLFESSGARRRCTLYTSLTAARVVRSNILEDEVAAVPFERGAISLDLRPYQLLTLRLALEAQSSGAP